MKELLVLGAGSDIAKELIKIYSREYDCLILYGRNKEKLNILKKKYEKICNIKLIIGNINNYNMFKELFENNKIDLVINCIGYAGIRAIANESIEALIELNRVNFESIAVIMKLCLQYNKNKNVRFVNLCSIASLYSHPYLAMYSAAKSALNSYSLSMNYELKESKLRQRVYSYILGATATKFFSYEIQKRIGGQAYMMKPQRVAAIIHRNIKRKKEYSVIGIRYKLLNIVLSILPRSLNLKILSKILKKAV